MVNRPSNIIFFIFIIIGLLLGKLFYVNYTLFLFFIPLPVMTLFFSKFRYVFLSIVLGLLLFNIHNMRYYSADVKLQQYDNKTLTIKGIIKEHKNFRFNSISIIEADKFIVQDQEINSPIRISTYSNRSYDHVVNDSIIISGKFQRYQKAKNLYEKDEIDLARNNKISGFMLSPKIISHKSILSISRIIFVIRSKIIEIFNDNLSYRSANFMNAIMIGSRESLEKSTIKEFSDSGTIHLLAVSGLHVGFLLLILTFFRRIFGYRINIHIVVSVTILISYVLLTGSTPSVVRAAIMSIIALFSFPMKRKMKMLDIIATAGMFSLIIDPNQIFQLGFILSFTAVLSIAIIYNFIIKVPPINTLVLKLGKFSPLLKGILVSVSASIGTLPVVLYYFGKFNLLSVLVNVVLIPLTGLNYLLGIVFVTASKIPLISEFLAYVINKTVGLMLKIVSEVSKINTFNLIYKINAFELIVIISFLVIVFMVSSKKVKIVLLSFMIIVITYFFFITSSGNYLYYFSTEKGDTAFASFDGQSILFLGNIRDREVTNIIKPYLFGKNIKKLDYIILLHNDPDIGSRINSLNMSVNYLVSSDENLSVESYKVIKIDQLNRMLKLFNSRIYFSKNYENVMLVYSEKKFLFCKTCNSKSDIFSYSGHSIIFREKIFNTEYGGVAVHLGGNDINIEKYDY